MWSRGRWSRAGLRAIVVSSSNHDRDVVLLLRMALGILGTLLTAAMASGAGGMAGGQCDGSGSSQDVGSETAAVVAPLAADHGSAPLMNRVSLGIRAAVGASAPGAVDPGAQPRVMAAGDFDEDGVPDLVVGTAAEGAGLVLLYRGNIEAIFPTSPTAKVRREGAKPFEPPITVATAPIVPDYLSAGDFDADGHLDLLATEIGSGRFSLYRGDGRGAFAVASHGTLPGEVTALVSGEVNRRDGLADVVVAVETAGGPQLLVFEHPAGAFSAPPEIIALDAPATALALGQLDDAFGIDIAVASGREIVVVHGRDRHRPGRAELPLRIDRLALPFVVTAMAVGDFVEEQPSRAELALVSVAGAVRLVDRLDHHKENGKHTAGEELVGGWTRIGDAGFVLSREVARVEGAQSEPGRIKLAVARMSGAPADDLLVWAKAEERLQIITSDGGRPSRGQFDAADAMSIVPPPPLANLSSGRATPRNTVVEAVGGDSGPPAAWISTFEADGPILAVLPMRLNRDALADMVVLREGQAAPIVLSPEVGEVVVVDSTTDIVDGDVSSIGALNATPGVDGVIGLREAITAANNTTGADAIHFAIPIASDPGCNADSGVCTIQPGGYGLPTITQPVIIDGTTQTSFAGTPVIEIDGSLADANATGLAISAGSSTIRGLVINRFATNSDIVMWTAGGNVVEGNFLGVDPSGTFNRGTTNSVHVYAISGNTIGGTTPAARNLISGNTNPGVALNAGASGNVVAGNFFGTDITGTVALGNGGNDVVTLDSPDNTIGGTGPGAGNLVAGGLDPDFASIGLGFPASIGNLVQGNLVGTDITGTVDLGGASIGVYIAEGAGNTVGGTSPAAANVISGGDSSGVGIAVGTGNVVQGNLIGTTIDGATPLPNASHGVLLYAGAGGNTVGGRGPGEGNTIAHNGGSGVDLRGDAGTGNEIVANAIFGNVGLGINSCADFDLGTLMCNDITAVTANDPDDPDVGANNLQNFPALMAVDTDGAVVDGALDSVPSSDYTIDIYASAACDPSGHGEGSSWLGSELISTDAGGDAAFSITLVSAVPTGYYVTATATDAAGNTSEFSECLNFPFDEIFADGFESGGTSAWSATTP
jgi:hypothetical protein